MAKYIEKDQRTRRLAIFLLMIYAVSAIVINTYHGAAHLFYRSPLHVGALITAFLITFVVAVYSVRLVISSIGSGAFPSAGAKLPSRSIQYYGMLAYAIRSLVLLAVFGLIAFMILAFVYYPLSTN